MDRMLRFYNGLRIFGVSNPPLRLTLDLPGVGLFAHLNIIAALAWRLPRRGRRFSVRCTTAAYAAEIGGDWFPALFEDIDPLRADERVADVVIVKHPHFPPDWRGAHLTLESARRAFFGKFRVRPEWLAQADRFARREFSRAGVLGVHYRGTDKAREAPRASYEQVLRRIEKRAASCRCTMVFLATDELEFAKFITRESPLPVVMRKHVLRSKGRQPVHLASSGDGLRKAGEAIVDFLLLSKCDALLKTASALSGWSALYNPNLSVEFINPPYEHSWFFPDSCLVPPDAAR